MYRATDGWYVEEVEVMIEVTFLDPRLGCCSCSLVAKVILGLHVPRCSDCLEHMEFGYFGFSANCIQSSIPPSASSRSPSYCCIHGSLMGFILEEQIRAL